MEIRDLAANRSFSGNGLWQWYEKPGLSGPAIPAGSERSWGRFEGRLNHKEEENSANEYGVKLCDLFQPEVAHFQFFPSCALAGL
jgi:hypothetical protein